MIREGQKEMEVGIWRGNYEVDEKVEWAEGNGEEVLSDCAIQMDEDGWVDGRIELRTQQGKWKMMDSFNIEKDEILTENYGKVVEEMELPDDVDCSSPVGNIQKCFCDRDEPIYKRCIKETLDELEPSTANSTIVYEISVILERVSQWPFLDPQVRELVWQLYDKVLWVRQEKFEQSNDRGFGSTKRFLSSIDRFLANSDANVTFLEGENLGLLKRPKPKCGDQFVALGIADYGSHFGEMNSDAMEGALASIQVPANVACQEEEKPKKMSAANSEEGVHFVLYRKAHFFVGDSTHPSNARFGRQTTDRSIRCKPGLFANEHRRVLSATVEGRNGNGTRNGEIAAKIRYRNKLPPLHGQSLVTWWNPLESFWSMNDTCKIVHNGQFMEAECPHLTDFTLLVDGMETDPSLCDGFLISLGYTLNMGSFLALFLLNAIYLIYKSPDLYERVFVQFLGDRLPKMQLDEQAMVYNLTLMFFYFSFGLFSDESHTGGGGIFCRAVALFNYWLLLACILLTIFQAWRILKMFLWTVAFERAVIVATRPKIVMAISFGLPAFLCLIFGLTLDDFFYRNDEFCWIRPTYVWFSVVLPLTILVLNAAICSMIIGLRLFPNSCGMKNVLERHASATIRLSKGARRKSRNKLTILLLMQFSLGMPWILQFATISIPHVTFTHFLFTLVNGSQGLILLSLFGFKQIQAWRTVRIKSKMENAAMPTTPAAENNVNVFTNSIGMRIPVAKPLANVQQQNNEEREEK